MTKKIEKLKNEVMKQVEIALAVYKNTGKDSFNSLINLVIEIKKIDLENKKKLTPLSSAFLLNQKKKIELLEKKLKRYIKIK